MNAASSRSLDAIVRLGRRFRQNGFHLNAPAGAIYTDNYVIPFAFSPGLSDGQTKTRGLAHKRKFGEVSALPIGETGWTESFIEQVFIGHLYSVPESSFVELLWYWKEIPRLGSGFRQRAQTPAKRLKKEKARLLGRALFLPSISIVTD